ncbi:MAG TPA: cupin domain-containing protein [Miltoncostaeaceae bacterium]|nr:cupin domain-containing protein [Miltoncostaeaceae bacterium]
MRISSLGEAEPFVTRDGSTIRELVGQVSLPALNQSLAEATLPAGGATERHHHRVAEEIYFIVEGTGRMELDGDERDVRPGDAILIPPGAWHRIEATGPGPLRLLCCCAPAYRHEDTYFA